MKFSKRAPALARFIIAVFMLPFAAALVWRFTGLVADFAGKADYSTLPFWGGLGSYFIFQAFFPKPVRLYVFAHELTHALAGIISGAKLKSFKVSSSGGSVILSKTNVLISLAPYFVPFYSVVLMIVYAVGAKFWKLGDYQPYFIFAMGFSLAFHFSLTHFALKQGQSDLKLYGIFFSSIFIATVNFIMLPVLLKLVFPGSVALKSFFAGSYNTTLLICSMLYAKAVLLWDFLARMK